MESESTHLLAKSASPSLDLSPPPPPHPVYATPLPVPGHVVRPSASRFSMSSLLSRWTGVHPDSQSQSQPPAQSDSQSLMRANDSNHSEADLDLQPWNSASRPSENETDRLFCAQVKVYLLTFISYAMSHYARKSYTFFKTTMNVEDSVPIGLQGWMDSVFMLAYAFGSFFSGHLGDEFHPPTVVALGMLGAATCVALLIVTLWSGFLLEYYTCTALFLLFVWLCHGAFQSTGGPVNTVIMGNWFSAEHRGLIFGSWTCHQYTGNILGALSSSLMLANHIPYYWALAIPVFANLCWAIVVYFYLPARPEDVGMELTHKRIMTSRISQHPSSVQNQSVPSASPMDGRLHTPSPLQLSMLASPSVVPHHRLTSYNTIARSTAIGTHTAPASKPPITIAEAFRIPMVSMYALAFGFFKLTNYTLFFWLPFFLSHTFSPAEANLISILYDIGMMPGGVLVGAISDWAGGRRTTVCVAMLLVMCPLLLFFGAFSEQLPVPALLALLGMLGLLVGGPNNIITSAVAADVALHPAIGGNHRALGTVTGIINGSGSITAALGLALVSWTQQQLGWMYVWTALVIGTLIGCALLMPRVIEEVLQWQRGDGDGYEAIKTITISESETGKTNAVVQPVTLRDAV